MNCPRCGNILRDDAPLCPGCGYVFAAQETVAGSYAADNGPEVVGLEEEPVLTVGADLRDEKLIKRIMRHRLFYPSVMIAAIVIVVLLFVGGSGKDKDKTAAQETEINDAASSTEVSGTDLGKYSGFYVARVDAHTEWNMHIVPNGEVYAVVLERLEDGNSAETIECVGAISDDDTELGLSKSRLMGKEFVDEGMGKLVKLSGNILQWNNGTGIVFTKSHETAMNFNMPAVPGTAVAKADEAAEPETEEIETEGAESEELSEEGEESESEEAEGAEAEETESEETKTETEVASAKSSSSSAATVSVAEELAKKKSSSESAAKAKAEEEAKKKAEAEEKAKAEEEAKKKSSSESAAKAKAEEEAKKKAEEEAKKSSSSAKKDEPEVLYKAVVNGFDGFVNLRAGASTNDSIIMELKNGAVVEVFSQKGKWLYVRYNGAMGYVAASQMVKQ